MGRGGLVAMPVLIPASIQEIFVHRTNPEVQRFCILSAAGWLYRSLW